MYIKNTIYVIDIEPIQTEYTIEWRIHLPKLLEQENILRGKDFNVVQISAKYQPNSNGIVEPYNTNYYKSAQFIQITDLFKEGKVNPGDHFIYTDAWNPTILQLKYISVLMNIPIKIHGLWHSGSYDSNNFLGRVKSSKEWLRQTEKSLALVIDHNYFATAYHKEIFESKIMEYRHMNHLQMNRCGWPMSYVKEYISGLQHINKRNRIIFPHRLIPETQVNIFKELAKNLPEYEWIVCKNAALTEREYHALLASSKIVFSASLHEYLGIAIYEGVIHKCIPMVPNRLSYKEMYLDKFKYNSEWTESILNSIVYMEDLKAWIKNIMENYDILQNDLAKQEKILSSDFFNSEVLYDNIFNTTNIIDNKLKK